MLNDLFTCHFFCLGDSELISLFAEHNRICFLQFSYYFRSAFDIGFLASFFVSTNDIGIFGSEQYLFINLDNLESFFDDII